MTIHLQMTCGACPEQYDAFDSDKKVGYLRLRHGRFTVECPNVGGDMVYSAYSRGDGIFESSERDYYLRFAVDAIERWQRGETRQTAPNVQYTIDAHFDFD